MMNDTFLYLGLYHNSKKKKQNKTKKTPFIGNRSKIFNMLAKSMHQIARIEFRNSKFPYARGLCHLATPARGLCPLDPRQGTSPLEPPSLVNIWAPPFQRLDPPLAQWRSQDVQGSWTKDSLGPLPRLHPLIPLTLPHIHPYSDFAYIYLYRQI